MENLKIEHKKFISSCISDIYRVKKKWNKFTSKIEKQDEKYGDNFTFIIVFTAAIFFRFFVVAIAAKFGYLDVSTFIAYVFQDFLVFLASLLTIWIVLSYVLRSNPKKLKYLMILASFLVVMPPFIDLVVTKGGGYWSFYINESLNGLYPIFISFFGHLPIAVKYFGTKIMVFVAVLLVGMYTGIKVFSESRSVYRTIFISLLSSFLVYIVFFFYASFPSWFSFLTFFILDGKSITTVTLANISSLFITPHPIFNTNSFDLSNALLGKLNMIYPLVIIILLLWKEKMDGNISGLSVMISKLKEKFSEKFVKIMLFIYTPVLFAFLNYFNNKPYQDLLFSFIYLVCVLLLFSLFAIFFTINSAKIKQIIGISMVMLAFVVGYKILFLFLVLVLGSYSMRLISINNYSVYLIFSSIITAFIFSIIFSFNQGFNIFSWDLLLYTVSTIIFIIMLKKQRKEEKISIEDRIISLVLGLAMIMMSLFSNIYILTEALVALFIFLTMIVFFIKKHSTYYRMLNYFIIMYLTFSLLSAFVLANIQQGNKILDKFLELLINFL